MAKQSKFQNGPSARLLAAKIIASDGQNYKNDLVRVKRFGRSLLFVNKEERQG